MDTERARTKGERGERGRKRKRERDRERRGRGKEGGGGSVCERKIEREKEGGGAETLWAIYGGDSGLCCCTCVTHFEH